MREGTLTVAVVALLVGSLVGAGATLGAVSPAAPGTDAPDQRVDRTDPNHTAAPFGPTDASLATFESEAAFADYVERGQRQLGHGFQVAPTRSRVTDDVATAAPQATPGPESVERETLDVTAGGDAGDAGGTDGSSPSRIGTTNVQVEGLDEPDRVKTDGRHFYYAPEADRPYRIQPVPGPDRDGDVATPGPRGDVATAGPGGDVATSGQPAEWERPSTHVVDASEPAAPEAVGEVNATGRLLQTGDRLVVLGHDRIAGYDVSDASSPSLAWERPLNDSVVTARERDGTVYLVTRSSVGHEPTCPVKPMGPEAAVACEDVHRPDGQIAVDATFTAFAVDAGSGDVADAVSFVGTNRNTVVYASGDALYVTYTRSTDRADLLGTYLVEEFDRTPESVVERVEEVRSYDLSAESERREIRRAVEEWQSDRPPDERYSVRTEFREGFEGYLADHQRDLVRTGIVRVDVAGSDLSVAETGTVPGRPLNQFSMDQRDGTLRIATTVPGAGSADSANDLYVLDAADLEERGAVTGMGVTERVYSVRYVDDTAYVVTFRRIDPFHVVDLSNPDDPEEVGKLELPGFSSYLHPIDDDHVLGIGEEDGQVKTVLFDVSDPSDPTIDDDRILDAGWSAVSESHHAFTIDREHGVFVLPTGDAAKVMGYENGSLSEVATIEADQRVSRTRYVEDYLYVFAGEEITVVDEETWEETTTLSLNE